MVQIVNDVARFIMTINPHCQKLAESIVVYTVSNVKPPVGDTDYCEVEFNADTAQLR